MCVVAVTIIVTSSPVFVEAETYYLAPGGTDSDTRGTADQPWKTVAYASSRMQAGDTLLLAGGTYTSETSITITRGGTIDAPVVYKAQSGQVPVIDLGYIKPVSDLPQVDQADTYRLPAGQPARSTGSQDQDRSILVQGSHLVFDGLTVQGCHTAFWGVTWSGRLSGLVIRNCTIRYAEQYALRLNSYDYCTMEGCTVYHCGMINWPRTGSNGWPHAVIGWSANHVTIERCVVHDNHGEGIGPFQGCAFWEIRECEVYDNWSVNIYIDTDSSDMTVDRNLSYCTGRYSLTGRNVPDGIRVANEIADMDYSQWGTPLDPTPAVPNVVITNNICINTAGGISAFAYAPNNRFVLKNSRVANNTIVRTPSGYRGMWIHGDNVEVANNLTVECPSPTYFTSAGAGVDAHDNMNGSSSDFVDGSGYAADNYRLVQSSPAVDGGAALAWITLDYWANPRPTGQGYDIGAHEYRTSTGRGRPSGPLRHAGSPGTLSVIADLCRQTKAGGATAFGLTGRRLPAARASAACVFPGNQTRGRPVPDGD